MKLTVATCQFPVGHILRDNLRYVSRQIQVAKDRDADIAHFPEAALSDYVGQDLATFEGFDWVLLDECTRKVLDLTEELSLRVVTGSAHRLTVLASLLSPADLHPCLSGPSRGT